MYTASFEVPKYDVPVVKPNLVMMNPARSFDSFSFDEENLRTRFETRVMSPAFSYSGIVRQQKKKKKKKGERERDR